MIVKRIFLFLAIAFFLFLGLYTWNRKTGHLDALATHTGLEAVAIVLKPYNWAASHITRFWSAYLDLVDVRAENDELQARVARQEKLLAQLAEDHAELKRLRKLLSLSERQEWEQVGGRVIGHRLGPLAALESVLIDKGFSNGALPGAPVMAWRGLAGKILRSSATASTVMLITNPGFRVAVVSQRHRIPAIVSGSGPGLPLDVKYIPPNAELLPGETLVTSGADGIFPKGIPVGIVQSIQPPTGNPFLTVKATPLVNVERMEEVLLLQPPLNEELILGTHPTPMISETPVSALTGKNG